MSGVQLLGQAAVDAKGWWPAHRFLILRRLSQLGILSAFLLGPWAGIWLVRGNLSSSRVLDLLDLSDPYVVVQAMFAGHWPARAALFGAALVAGFYLIVGGRAYCGWVCPVNLVTDLAEWLRRRFELRGGASIRRTTRYWMLAMTLAAAAVSGTLAWELFNPVSMLHRALIFGAGLAWTVLCAVFLTDLLIARRAWCGTLCPMGAFYSLVNLFSIIKVRATRRDRCNDCAECYVVCPEPQVIKPALKGAASGVGPVIKGAACTNCGRCVDVCSRSVFGYGVRFEKWENERE